MTTETTPFEQKAHEILKSNYRSQVALKRLIANALKQAHSDGYDKAREMIYDDPE